MSYNNIIHCRIAWIAARGADYCFFIQICYSKTKKWTRNMSSKSPSSIVIYTRAEMLTLTLGRVKRAF